MSAAAPAALAETHTAVVFFVGDRAYKLKKPVSFGFVDFRTRPARQEACRREVELNRRIAPDVYLGVADVSAPDGTLCDHLVVMRRMPIDRRLTSCLARGEDIRDGLRAVAHVVVALQSRSPHSCLIDAAGSATTIRSHWDDSFRELEPAVGTLLDQDTCHRIERLAHRYLDGRTLLFEERIRDGRIVDGHGDLLGEDIFLLADGPRILDCLEFDDSLRWGDGLLDAAFLAMDLERCGRPDLGDSFLASYQELSADRWPRSLADHYIAYRAHVRAKVAVLRHDQGDASAADQAGSLLAMTARHLEAGRVRLILVGGLPGTGKSTHAQELSDRGLGVLLRSDEIRKQQAGLSSRDRASAPYGAGIYQADLSEAVYDELLRDASTLLQLGESVILDASWKRAGWRERARRVAEQTSSDLVEVQCVAPLSLTCLRLEQRARETVDASDATAAVATLMAPEFDRWPEATTLDTSEPIDLAQARAVGAITSSSHSG